MPGLQLFAAVTFTRIVEPTSVGPRSRLVEIAPPMFAHEAPELLHRCH